MEAQSRVSKRAEKKSKNSKKWINKGVATFKFIADLGRVLNLLGLSEDE